MTCLIFFQGTINNNHIANITTPKISEPGNNGRIIGILERNIKKDPRINLINKGIWKPCLKNLNILYSIYFYIVLNLLNIMEIFSKKERLNLYKFCKTCF